jgi:hypothetical protein
MIRVRVKPEPGSLTAATEADSDSDSEFTAGGGEPASHWHGPAVPGSICKLLR